MTRYWITLDRAVEEIVYALDTAQGGETSTPSHARIVGMPSIVSVNCSTMVPLLLFASGEGS